MIEQSDYILLEKLKYFQLIEIFFEPTKWSINLTFVCGYNPEIDNIAIKLSNIVHFVWSKAPDDNDGCYSVYEIRLTELDDGGAKILSKLGYPLKNSDGNVFSYPSKQLFHFYLEGDIHLEVVCGNYQLFQLKNNT